MDVILSISAIILVNIIAWITPGPNMLAVMAASLQHGRKHGIATGLGLACATFIWATLAVLGVAILFELFPHAVLAFKLFGAAYLIWLGMKQIKDSTRINESSQLTAQSSRSALKSILNGFFVGISNPKAALFFSSVMTAFIPAGSSSWYLSFIVLLCVALSVIFHTITSTVFSTSIALSFFNKCKRWMSLAFGALFIGLGGSVAYAALRRS